MSTTHCASQDIMRIFKDIRAKKVVVMHWGRAVFYPFFVCLFSSSTWILTTEEVTEPPKRLAEEYKKIGIDDGDFPVSDIGETKFF
ncbi:hypothetical protein EV421DRAFT_1841015 [Armillaria borealis]|uniref:Metallo-beta-lactamase domain-containing protein n=1 Tax=Armillaria borealis TaxID=47425 RepID=A0AA39MHN0_9AGAR|nr:hypothetical protein EV421DRAFT_1858613 [Armillaria borealis]KAK0434178.1 hypothetical protein EV421DRAFT_1841015 [Armillaria borealis]